MKQRGSKKCGEQKEIRQQKARELSLTRPLAAAAALTWLCEWLQEPSSAFPFLAGLYVEVTPNGR